MCLTCRRSRPIKACEFHDISINAGSSVVDGLNDYRRKELVDGVECRSCWAKNCLEELRESGDDQYDVELVQRLKSLDPEDDQTFHWLERDMELHTFTLDVPRRRFEKFLSFFRLPQILTVHVQRRVMSRSGSPIKDYRPCKAQELIEIEGIQYELKSIIEHLGTGEGGHYVSFRKIGMEWVRVSDEVVTRMKPNERAFMMFYERIIKKG